MNRALKTGCIALCLIAGVGTTGMAPAGALTKKVERPEGFPERPLTMIVPYGPGGGSGQVARAMIEAVKEATGIEIKPEYKPGNAGVTGLRAFMDTRADGHAVLEHIDDAVSAYAIGKSQVNPADDLIPLVISQITFSQIYIRSSESRFTDWASFVEYVQAQGGKATIANVAGKGSMERLNMNRIAKHFDFKIQQISFDKGKSRYAALRDGQVDALFEQPGDVRPFLDNREFKPILTLLKDRPKAFAKVPSMTDVGLDFTPLMRFRGFFAHKEAPPERVAWLKWAFQKAFHQPSYMAYNKKKYMDLVPSFRNSEDAKALINKTLEIYRQTYKEMGLIE